MPSVIRAASSAHDFESMASLISEYVVWMRLRYKDDDWFISEVLDKQSLSSELATLSQCYGAPNGQALLAQENGEVRGCAAFRRLDDQTCEMKRVFVPDRYRGSGFGRRLCEALIHCAKQDGYTTMKLDTLNQMTEAIGMYQSLGFRRCAPYVDYPANLMPYFVFMELPLLAQASA